MMAGKAPLFMLQTSAVASSMQLRLDIMHALHAGALHLLPAKRCGACIPYCNCMLKLFSACCQAQVLCKLTRAVSV